MSTADDDAGEKPVFSVTLDIRYPFSPEVNAGTSFSLPVTLETESGCDFAGAPYEVRNAEGEVVATGELPELRQITPDSEDYDPRHGPVDTRPFTILTLSAPPELGTHAFTVVIPAIEIDEIGHEEGAVTVELVAEEHKSSIACWNNPSPVQAGEAFSVRVGMKCSGACMLGGKRVEVSDAEGNVLGTGVLGDEPAPGTTALYFVDISLTAPEAPGPARWTARVLETDETLPHTLPAPASFSFMVTPAGEHTVSVSIHDEATGDPVPGTVLRMGPYRVFGGADGTASFSVAGGAYTLRIWKDDFEAPSQALEVSGDITLSIGIAVPAEEDPYERYWRPRD